MILKKIVIKNFKKFKEKTFEFNNDRNIIVGDNESGKSTLLEAIEICLNYSYRGKPLNAELSTDLFNNECVEAWLDGNKAQNTLPEILIEAHIDGNPEFRGNNNNTGEDTEGIFVKISFDSDASDYYAQFIKDPSKVTTLPVELYKAEWWSFAHSRVTHYNKNIKCLFIDPSRLHPTYGRTKYINAIIDSTLDKNARATLNLNYRQLKATFDEQEDVKAVNNKLDEKKEITKKPLRVTADIATTTSWEGGLQIAVDDVSFSHIGKGEQNQIQIKLALQNKSDDIDIVMVEEPENHLSYINLVQLIKYIEEKNKDKQIFLTTHSSYVLNKLSIDKLCFVTNGGYIRLKEVESDTVKMLKRLPGYDTLRVILASKIILVEGPSDELLLKKIYLNTYKHLPEEDGIDIIVVRGIGFGTYLNIAKPLKHPVRVVKDNDGDYQKNITNWLDNNYKDCSVIEVYSPQDNSLYSLEPALIEKNGSTQVKLDVLAKVMLSTQTFNQYNQKKSLEERKEFLKSWFNVENSGARKVDSAIRIFDSEVEIDYPDYLVNAVTFNA